MISEPERGQAIAQVIVGIGSSKSWYDQGSGRSIPANYANDAIVIIVPNLTREETLRALAAITTQAGDPRYQQVFGPTVKLLNAHLAETRHSA